MSGGFSQELLQINSSNFTPPSEQDRKSGSQCFDTPKTEITNPSPRAPSPPITFQPNSAELEAISDYDTDHILQPKLHSGISRHTTQNPSNSNLNLRYRNMLNFPKYLHKKSMAFEKRIRRSGIIADPTCTLKILQRFLQPFINREIDAVIKKYSKDFLTTAIENIRFNLGESAVSKNELQHLQYNILKDAAAQYWISEFESPCHCSHGGNATSTIAVNAPSTGYSDLATSIAAGAISSTDLRRSVLLRTSARHLRRRTTSNNINPTIRAPLTTSSPSSDHIGLMLLPSEGTGGGGTSPFLLSSLGEVGVEDDGGRSTPAKRRRKYGGPENNAFMDNVTPLNGSLITDVDSPAVDALGSLELELPDSASHGQASSTASDVASNATGQSFHHLSVASHPLPQLLPSDTFALGSCANSWLGLGAARGRIYSKHPWIFRYACDREDKVWLSRAGHLPNSGAKAFLVLVKQIQEVADLEEREEGFVIPTTRQPLPQFTLPPRIFQKVLNSTLTRRNIPGSRPSGGQYGSSAANRHFWSAKSRTSTSSARRPPSLQRSTPFVDQFAFTEEEVGLEEGLFKTDGDVQPAAHLGPWPNGERPLSPIRNGRSHNTQSDTVYKGSRQGETGLKIAHI
ncbi:hypothetical protein Aperf_G00000091299 [Anoplocephala perfoliata]